MEAYNVIVGFFKNGGVFMIPIVIILALGAAIAIERWVFLTITTAKNKALWNAVTPYLKAGNFAGAMQVTQKSGAAIAQIMTYGLNRIRSARRREDIEQAMEESLMEVLPRLEKRTHYLATFANLATLLGLLGTVNGLIHAFTAVATANPAEKANLLAASISEAMNCTAFGLMVAVPVLFVHSFLQSKTSQLIASLETGAVNFLTNVADRQTAKAQARLDAAQGATHGGSTTSSGSDPLPAHA
jgi:biopolymer transport protein ExbB/TolQ